MQAERRCEKCGQVIPWGEQKCPACGEEGRFLWSVPRNTLFLLSFLALVILFLVTSFAVRAFQAREREVAQERYAWGERELSSGRPEAALEDFRSALAYTRNDSHIELQLAHTLAAAGHFPEARAYLLSLWEKEPGSGTVNLELGRLAAHSGSAAQAVQYYHDAVYGLWEDNPAEHRRQARLELAEFLLGVGQKTQAQAELIALAADLPHDPALETEAGALLLNSGEYEHAARLFQEALRLRPNYSPALEGAGEASFEVGHYSDARRYFARASRQSPLSSQPQAHLVLATLIVENDPLARHLSSQERAQRTLRALTQSMERLNGCAAARGVSFAEESQPSDLQKMHALAVALRPKVREARLARDPDLMMQVTDLVFAIEKVTERECGEAQGLDLALLLLARMQEGGNP